MAVSPRDTVPLVNLKKKKLVYYGGYYNLWFLITCLGDHSEVRLERWHLFEGLETESMGLTSALASLIALSDSKRIYANVTNTRHTDLWVPPINP